MFKTIAIKIALFVIPFFALVGCASPSSQQEAISHVRPFTAALQAYHHKFNDYPQQLDELRPRYLGADVPIFDRTDPRHRWFLWYERADQDNYTIYLDTSPCSQAVFKDGTFVAGYGPNFR
jgi:hypothetical protein